MTATEVRPSGPPTAPPVPFGTAGPQVGLLPPSPERHFSLLHVGHLPAAVRESRHRMLIAILAVHVPFVLLLGIARHHGAATSAELMLPTLVAVLGARFLGDRLLRSASVVLGLCWSSYAIVHLSDGAAEAKLHPLLVIVLVALYQDPALLIGAVVALAAMLAVPSALDSALVYSKGARHHAWAWTGTNVIAILGVAAAAAFQWRRDVAVPVFADPAPVAETEDDEPDPDVAEHIERARAAELALARRQATYALMTNLARRNQSLVGRQLSTLDDLERDERDPDVLAGLFALDHLATRMRRNAENLLVLAGAGNTGSRSFAQPVPVEELLRGAAAEVEQYARVDVHVGADAAIAGHAVSDVAHLLAELLDNALACSPPDTQVVVGAAPASDGGLRLWVADEGIGMTAARLTEFNALLSDTDGELEVGATLGFPVVKRLAARHDLHVVLGSREGGQPGLVAYVDLPAEVVRTDAPPAASVVAPSAAAGAALPGRRAARRVTEDVTKQRRNELALDAAAENWFHPAPIPTAGEVDEDEDEGWAWGTPSPAATVPAMEQPAVAPPTSGLPTREAGGSPLGRPEGLPQRPSSAPPFAAADDDAGTTTPLDLAALRASVGADPAAPAPESSAFLPPPATEPEPAALPATNTVPEPVAFAPEPISFEPAPIAFEPEPAAVPEPATFEPTAFEPEPVAVESEPADGPDVTETADLSAIAAELATHAEADAASDHADERHDLEPAHDDHVADGHAPEVHELADVPDETEADAAPADLSEADVAPATAGSDSSSDDDAAAHANATDHGFAATAEPAATTAPDADVEPDAWATEDLAAPSGGAYDDILFGSAPLPSDDDLPPLPDLEPEPAVPAPATAPAAEPADAPADLPTVPQQAIAHDPDELVPWSGPTPPAAASAPTTDTIVPTQATRGGLTRRVPQQALREAGGSLAPQVFQPGPAFGAAPGGDVDPSERMAPPDPGRSSGVLASYRAGLQRARAAASEQTPESIDTNAENGEGA